MWKWGACLLGISLAVAGCADEWVEVRCLPATPFTYCIFAEGCGVGGQFVKFSPDGRLLGTISSTGPSREVRIWDFETGKLLYVFHAPHPWMPCFSLDFSPDSRLVAVGFASWLAPTVRVWDVTTGHLVYELVEPLSKGPPLSQGYPWPAFSPDGKWLAVSLWEKKMVKIWDVASGKELHVISAPVDVLAFSPDGNLLAGALVEDQDFRIKLWRVGTWEEVLTLPGHTDIYCLSFSPNSKLLATAFSDGTIKLWDVAGGQEVRTFLGHTGGLLSIAFSPDGRFLASSARDHTIRLWDVASGQGILAIDLWHLLKLGEGFETEEQLALAKKVTRIHAVAYSPDGTLLASSIEIMRPDRCDEAILIWHLAALVAK